MKRYICSRIGVSLLISFTLLSAGCEKVGTEQSSTVSQPDVSSEYSEAQTTAESSQTDAPPETSAVEEEHKYIENGRFSLPDNTFSFDVPEGWEMTDNGVAFQFENEDSVNNTFNLISTATYSSVEDVTQEQMAGTYETMMTDFQLIDFQHTDIKGKPAVYMNISGKYSMMTTDTVIYQYEIQSGETLYTLSFSQGGWDDGFSDMITALIDSIEIK